LDISEKVCFVKALKDLCKNPAGLESPLNKAEFIAKTKKTSSAPSIMIPVWFVFFQNRLESIYFN
jgi:hypothetical protein